MTLGPPFALFAILSWTRSGAVILRTTPPPPPPPDAYAEWECPGFPCFIVNHFDTHPHSDLKQTCGSQGEMSICLSLEAGRAFETGSFQHSPTRPHACRSDMWGCMQAYCVQGSLSGCYSACQKLHLLNFNARAYNASCYEFCNSPSSGCLPA